jgi:phage terminase large subunit-like protein
MKKQTRGGTKAPEAKNYILEYYQAITDGSVTVGHWIREWYGQIVTGLQERRFFFNQKKANMAVRFVQTFCRHHEGALAPGRIRLELWQKALLSVIFGIVDEDGIRVFREILIVMGRKNGKTLLAACIMALILYMDPDYGKRVYTVATKLDQARLSYEALYQMILKEPELAEITQKRRTDIYIAETNSSAMPIAFSEKKTDGLNPSGAVCDELGAWQGEQGMRQYQVIKSALGARKQPMLVSITTAGYVSDGIYDEMIRRATAVINGTSRETRLAPFLYMIDDPDKWDNISEIAKANPNLGVSLTVDNMLEEIAAAEQSLSQAAEFKTKVCNLRQNSSAAWMNAKDVQLCFSETGKTLEDFRHTYALSGLDLSMSTDLTATILLVQKADVVWFFARFYMPKNKIEEATARDGIPYRKYVEQGYLILSGENVVDYHDVERFYQDLVQKYEILPQKNGYDRYSAAYLVQDLEGMGFHMESVSQGSNLTGVIIDVEGMIKDGRLKSAEDNNLMKIHMMDSALQMYEDNRRRLVKVSSTAHIDGMAALLDAMTMRRNYYTEMEHLLRNERGQN